MIDDLSEPLGRNTEARRVRLPIRFSHLMAGALGLFVSVFAIWAMVADDPLGGEPVVVLPTGLGPGQPNRTMAATPLDDPQPKKIEVSEATMRETPAAPPPPVNPAPPTHTITIIDGSTGQRREIPIPGQQVSALQTPQQHADVPLPPARTRPPRPPAR